jgi:hypothetical protein
VASEGLPKKGRKRKKLYSVAKKANEQVKAFGSLEGEVQKTNRGLSSINNLQLLRVGGVVKHFPGRANSIFRAGGLPG